MPDSAGKRAYQGRYPARPAVRRHRRTGGRCGVRIYLGRSDPEMVEFSILDEVSRGGSKTTVLDFQRVD